MTCVHGPHLLDGLDRCVCGVQWTREEVTAAINAPGGEYPGQPVDDDWSWIEIYPGAGSDS